MNLCIFMILLLMRFIHTVDGRIKAIPGLLSNQTKEIFNDVKAEFGGDIPSSDIVGVLALADPREACTHVKPKPSNSSYRYFLLVEESLNNRCAYTTQAMHAQVGGYDVVIIYRRHRRSKLIEMPGEGPSIISVCVSNKAGTILQKFLDYTGSTIRLSKDYQYPLQLYLIPFAVVVCVCFFFMVIFSIVRYARFRLRERRARLTPANLKKIPTKKFQKGDEFDMCAICIEDYEEGDKIRLLPCNHAYHCKCVDPWLTAGKKLCPVCKQSVEIPKKKKKKRTATFDGASTSSQPTATETETEDDFETDNERTPLLSERDRRDSDVGSTVEM